MPATEQTWRNLKILHVVFGLVAIVLLLATVLMLAADHNRPWKKYARGFRNLETWSAAARVAEQDSAAYEARRTELEDQLAAARRADLDAALAKQFIAQVRTVPADAEAADRAQLDVDQLASQADPDERLVLRGDLLARLRDIAKRAKFREDLLAGALKLRKAELDKNRADTSWPSPRACPSSGRRSCWRSPTRSGPRSMRPPSNSRPPTPTARSSTPRC